MNQITFFCTCFYTFQNLLFLLVLRAFFFFIHIKKEERKRRKRERRGENVFTVLVNPFYNPEYHKTELFALFLSSSLLSPLSSLKEKERKERRERKKEVNEWNGKKPSKQHLFLILFHILLSDHSLSSSFLLSFLLLPFFFFSDGRTNITTRTFFSHLFSISFSSISSFSSGEKVSLSSKYFLSPEKNSL